MLARSIARCRPRITFPARHSVHTRLSLARQVRHYASPSSASPAAAPATSTAGMLAPFTSELDRIAPKFSLDGGRIRVLQTPAEFYETLKDKIGGAERRIFLSTLYIGKTETELVRLSQELNLSRCIC
jgi:CDP-diacylglycerol---glycerol-3-phosphate 3-phosphatidyltransferase